eukprot:2910528-Pleurochrysis_carterae.AAC.2
MSVSEQTERAPPTCGSSSHPLHVYPSIWMSCQRCCRAGRLRRCRADADSDPTAIFARIPTLVARIPALSARIPALFARTAALSTRIPASSPGFPRFLQGFSRFPLGFHALT